MLLSLLIYCYANGIFSSRRIERATYRDVAVRYLTGCKLKNPVGQGGFAVVDMRYYRKVAYKF